MGRTPSASGRALNLESVGINMSIVLWKEREGLDAPRGDEGDGVVPVSSQVRTTPSVQPAEWPNVEVESSVKINTCSSTPHRETRTSGSHPGNIWFELIIREGG